MPASRPAHVGRGPGYGAALQAPDEDLSAADDTIVADMASRDDSPARRVKVDRRGETLRQAE